VDGTGSEAKVRIYTVAGDLVRTVEVFFRQSDGSYACAWDGKNEKGKEAAAGIYVFLITNQGRTGRGTLVRIK
jgi:flagellar hook assembly protein FlgD